MYRHLLVPTDGSNLSRETVQEAVAFARAIRARITILHAQQLQLAVNELLLEGQAAALTPALDQRLQEASQAHAETVLAEAREVAESAGVSCDTITFPTAVVSEAIIETADRQGCDLIFMASHGRRGLAGLVLGSETQRVLCHTEIPVLVHRHRSLAKGDA
ncbi:universal stress protein [Synechococcus sp. RSCCF101]|uniref:universal stress protein n=1 Tax=Synechococcus sp. RSCCF101 TaxID=2511069 RepID=UPI001246EE05|nr:universal stress protein [Synechococcus sp. RSCCF101]QEY31071.1 universal stress protein [Synechococcus sp. RSCCF101]